MRFVKSFAFPFLLVLVLPAMVKAQAKTVPPTIVVRLNSIDALVQHAKFLASLVGQNDAARQIEGLIKSTLGDKGLDGVDSTRPLGAYGRIGKELDDISGAVLIPIANEKAFLDLLTKFGITTIRGRDGVYTVKTNTPIDAYLRFANKYAYVTALNTAALDEKNLLDPLMVLAGKPSTPFALTIQLNQIPDAAKLITTGQAEQVLQEAQNKTIEGESPAQKAFRVAALQESAKIIAMVLKDGGELKTDIDVNQASGDLAASFSISGTSGSELANKIQAMAKGPSMFTGLLKKDAAFNGMGHIKLSAALTKALVNVIEEARTKALEGIADADKKQQADTLFKVILPTFQTGDFDGAAVVMSKGQKLSVVTAFKVKDGNELGKTIRDLVSTKLKDAPPAVKDNIKLDFETVGATKIHKIDLAFLGAEAKKLETLVGTPVLYVAFRNDALFMSLGKDSLQGIKEALPVQPTGTSPLFFYEVDVARLMYLAPPEQADAAKKLFPTSSGGIVRLSVDGGQAITVRLTMKVAALKLLGQVHEAVAPK